MKIGKILRKARIDAGLTLKKVEESTGVITSAQSKIEIGEVSSPSFMHIAALAKFYKLSLAGLYEAINNEDDSTAIFAKTLQSNHIPIISWVQAGSWCDTPLNHHDFKMIPSPFKCSDSAYALEVKGDSMTVTNGTKHNFPEGSIIVVEPNSEARHRDFVIAMIDGTNDATFKRLSLEGGKFLQPLNPQFSVIPIDRPINICGVVIGVIQAV